MRRGAGGRGGEGGRVTGRKRRTGEGEQEKGSEDSWGKMLKLELTPYKRGGWVWKANFGMWPSTVAWRD